MQTTGAVFKEYIWLVKTIHIAKRITLRELNERWRETEMSGGLELARTTFNRHKAAIEEIFGIYIECDRKDHFRYFIGNDHVLKEDSIQNWMLSTLSVNNTISECRSLHENIMLETIPTEGEELTNIIDALKANKVLSITYKKYSSSIEKIYVVEPYCIKLFHRRWYLLCKKRDTGEYRTLSFDRMIEISATNQKFEKDDIFNAELYYKDYFGIVSGDDSKIEKVIVRAYGTERLSMRDLPIHSSQKEIVTETDYSDFELNLHITLDFAGYLVSRSHLIKVLEPETLVNQICELHKKALDLYPKYRYHV